jgi:uncharacterized RDD family membrane protein YckC
MKRRERDRSLGTGVYYAPGDYVGFWRRVVILIVDSLALGFGLTLLYLGWSLAIPRYPTFFLLSAIAFAWWYEVLLKRSRFRTLAYWLMDCKIVNLQGERPGLFALTLRSLLVFGPIHYLLDLLWSGIDEDRQTLRDRYCKTCLVKVNAEPIGTGDVQLTQYFAAGFSLAYPHVLHPATKVAQTGEIEKE